MEAPQPRRGVKHRPQPKHGREPIPVPAGQVIYDSLKTSFVDFPRLITTLEKEGYTGYVRLLTEDASGLILFREGSGARVHVRRGRRRSSRPRPRQAGAAAVQRRRDQRTRRARRGRAVVRADRRPLRADRLAADVHRAVRVVGRHEGAAQVPERPEAERQRDDPGRGRHRRDHPRRGRARRCLHERVARHLRQAGPGAGALRRPERDDRGQVGGHARRTRRSTSTRSSPGSAAAHGPQRAAPRRRRPRSTAPPAEPATSQIPVMRRSSGDCDVSGDAARELPTPPSMPAMPMHAGRADHAAARRPGRSSTGPRSSPSSRRWPRTRSATAPAR